MLIFLVLVLAAAVVIRLMKFIGFFSGSTCTDRSDLSGKVVLITGANSGVGFAVAMDLSRRNPKMVILGCRNMETGKEAVRKIKAAVGGGGTTAVELLNLDLQSLESVKSFVSSVQALTDKVHVLVNNAGVIAAPFEFAGGNLEMNFAVNYLGHFHLVRSLEPLLIRAAADDGDSNDVRIVNVSSVAHLLCWFRGGLDVHHPRFGWKDWALEGPQNMFSLYGQSKLAMIYHAAELSERYRSMGLPITAYSVHPGVVDSGIDRSFQFLRRSGVLAAVKRRLFCLIAKTPEQGAQTVLHCCVSKDVLQHPGSYFVECQREELLGLAKDRSVQKKLWSLSEDILAKLLHC